jgi:hypothetical protein
MSDYLVFDTQAAASTALETIYANMVAAIPSTDLLNVDTQEVVVKDDLTPAEMVGVGADARHYPIFGVNAATSELEVMEGYTTAWAVAQETVGGKWVFPKPSDVLMVGVVGFVVEPFDPAWFPQPLESLTA